MTSLLQGVLAVGIVLLPGACAAWGFRRHTSSYGGRLRDWLLRLGGLSAATWAIGGWPMYWTYANYWQSFASGQPVPRALALVPLAYLAVPLAAGLTTGWAVAHHKRWAVALLGSRRAPRAWDRLFERPPSAFVRCRMKSGAWIGGLYDESAMPASYAAGETDALDLYVSRAVRLDQQSGAIRYRAASGAEGGGSSSDLSAAFTGGGLLISWDEVEYLEFVPGDTIPDSSPADRRDGLETAK